MNVFFSYMFVLIYFFLLFFFLSVFIYYLYIYSLPIFFVLSKPPFLPIFALPTRKDYETREKEFCHVGEGNGAGLREEKWVPLPGEWILNVVFLRACVGLISAWLDVQFWLITSSGLLLFFSLLMVSFFSFWMSYCCHCYCRWIICLHFWGFFSTVDIVNIVNFANRSCSWMRCSYRYCNIWRDIISIIISIFFFSISIFFYRYHYFRHYYLCDETF